MASVSISGLGSGIDFDSVRDAIINQKALPITQLRTRVGKYNSRVSSLKDLNALLATLTTTAKDLTKAEVGTGRTATAGDASVASVSAGSSAALGTVNLNVMRLATSFAQASRSFSSVDAPVLAGGAQSATFELRVGGAGEGTAITIDSANNTLTGLRDAINAAGAGVKASIVDLAGDGTQQQLVLNSTETGARGRVELVETSATGTGTALNFRSLNPPDGDFSKLNALIAINGLEISRPTNTVNDAVSGVSMSLKKVGSTAIEITRSSEVADKLDAFAKAYNSIQDFIGEQYKKDGDGKPIGVLAGDAVLRNVQKQISSIIGLSSADNGGSLTSLSQIGITLAKTGKLEFDKDVLNERIAANADDVSALLHGKTEAQTGVFQTAYGYANDLSDNVTGSVQTAINGYEASVKNLNETIEKRTATLNDMRDILTRRFAAADAAIGQLNGQGTALTNFLKTLSNSNNS